MTCRLYVFRCCLCRARRGAPPPCWPRPGVQQQQHRQLEDAGARGGRRLGIGAPRLKAVVVAKSAFDSRLSREYTFREMGTCLSLPPDDFVEGRGPAGRNELVVGELREVKIDSHPCVVVKDASGRVNAVSGKCTHYGANPGQGLLRRRPHPLPLARRLLQRDHRRHRGTSPGLDSLQTFEVVIEGGGRQGAG
ncbi:unnamed protein product [Sphagnum tenellum]